MTINVWNYLDEYEQERSELLAAVDRVFSSGQLILGPSVRSFEDEFAAYHGVDHAIGVDNGTNAIVLGLQALGVTTDDEVITVSNTAAPTVVAIDTTGARPVFVDVHRSSQLMDVSKVEAAITEKTKAIVPVHLYGQSVDMDPLLAVATDRGIRVLEDCAQSHGASYKGRPVGTLGDAAAFSFYPTKVLGAYGDGGAVITKDDHIEAALRRLRYYGMVDRYYVDQTPGHNSRLDEVQAEILRSKLTRLPLYIQRRQEIADRYERELRDLPGLELPTTNAGNTHVYYLYVARHPKREKIIKVAADHEVNLNVSYRWPCHTMRGFAHLGYAEGSLPVTETLADEIFSLPMYPSLTDTDQRRVITAVQQAIG